MLTISLGIAMWLISKNTTIEGSFGAVFVLTLIGDAALIAYGMSLVSEAMRCP